VSTPNFSAILEQIWGWPIDATGQLPYLSSANNVVLGTNPAFTLFDFYLFNPKFGGTSATLTGDITAGSNDVANCTPPTNLAVGNPVSGDGIPAGAYITAVNSGTITLSVAATATATGITIAMYYAPAIPFVVQRAYLALALACLVQARWQDTWQLGISLFVAHWLTLWARTDAGSNPSASQIASQGLTFGILVSKAVGSVSASYQPVGGLENWAAWNLTVYGQQLATLARIIGSGPMLLW
jgi:Protein of unknown function (DUF4054)